jgi:signal peptidase
MKSEIDSRGINMGFLFFVLLAMVLPAIFTSYFGLSANTVVSGSMRPDIEPGDVIIATQKSSSDVRIGDVVIFLDRKTWQVQAHRVIEKKTKDEVNTFTTKGDANSEADGPFEIGASAPLRTTSIVLPNIGYALNTLQRGDVRAGIGITLLAIMTILIFGSENQKARRSRKNQDSAQPLSPELNER